MKYQRKRQESGNIKLLEKSIKNLMEIVSLSEDEIKRYEAIRKLSKNGGKLWMMQKK